MSSAQGEDRKEAGASGPDNRDQRLSIPMPIAAAIVVGLFTLLNGFLTYSTGSSNDLLDAHMNLLTSKIESLDARLDRIHVRLTHLEQTRMTKQDSEAPDLVASAEGK